MEYTWPAASAASPSWCGAAMAAVHSTLPPHTLTHSPTALTSQPPAEIGDFWTQNNAHGRCAQLLSTTNGRVHFLAGEAGTGRRCHVSPAPPRTALLQRRTCTPSHISLSCIGLLWKLMVAVCRGGREVPPGVDSNAPITVKTRQTSTAAEGKAGPALSDGAINEISAGLVLNFY